jgi:peptide/nickel transport system permease protein
VSITTALPVGDLGVDRHRGVLVMLRATGPVGIASAVVIAIAAFVACFGVLLAPYNPTVGNLTNAYLGPSAGHLLGFDVDGRDVVSRLLAGTWTSMLGPLFVVAICIAAGTGLAIFAAWRGGAVDTFLSSGMDIVFAFPGILLAIVAAAVFGAGLTAASIALAIAYTPYVARVLRGAALRERGREYVAALEVQGVSSVRICLGHILPNIAPLIVAQATILFGYAMVTLAAISYLGLGVQPPAPNWGVMVSENQQGILTGAPLPALSAGIAIVVVVIAFNLLGERLFDVASKGVR